MNAIIVTGGKQYKVAEGDVVYIEKLNQEAGDTVKNGKGKKIRIFKYNAKKGYRKRQGHRQPYTKVEIGKISV